MHYWRGKHSPHEAEQAIIEDAANAEAEIRVHLQAARRELEQVRAKVFQHQNAGAVEPGTMQPIHDRSSATGAQKVPTPLEELRKIEAALLAKISDFEDRVRQFEAAYRERQHVQARDEAMQKLRDEFEAEEAVAKEERYKEFLARKGRRLS